MFGIISEGLVPLAMAVPTPCRVPANMENICWCKHDQQDLILVLINQIGL